MNGIVQLDDRIDDRGGGRKNLSLAGSVFCAGIMGVLVGNKADAVLFSKVQVKAELDRPGAADLIPCCL